MKSSPIKLMALCAIVGGACSVSSALVPICKRGITKVQKPAWHYDVSARWAWSELYHGQLVQRYQVSTRIQQDKALRSRTRMIPDETDPVYISACPQKPAPSQLLNCDHAFASRSVYEIATAGWPCKWMEYRVTIIENGRPISGVANMSIATLCEAIIGRDSNRVVLIRKATLITNTVLHSVVLWVIGCASLWVVRWNRRRHSRCDWCGYDKNGLIDAACPECGAS